MKKICLLGGTGFVGRRLASELTRRGHAIVVLTRRRERHRGLLVFPRLDLRDGDPYHDPDLESAFTGCDAVVNLVGILNETGGQTFARAHVDLPRRVAAACRARGVPRLLHMSALGAGPDGPSRYLTSKGEGEEAVHAAADEGFRVTSFRPSVLFGPDDDFFNRFATLLRITPYLFPLAAPGALLAPAYVEDVVEAFADALDMRSTWGQRYDLCGPRTYTLRELVEYTASTAGLRRRVIGLDERLSRLQARVLERFPGKPFSVDNYLSLTVDNVAEVNGFDHFGIEPTGVEAIVPGYLGPEARTGRYGRFRSAAGRS